MMHPGKAALRLESLITDADAQETRACENACGQRSASRSWAVFQHASHGWCGWHRINRGFTNHPKYHAALCKAKSDNILSRVEVDVIVHWMWYFVKHYENDEEIELSSTLMNFYLGGDDQDLHFGQLDSEVRLLISNFLT